MSRGDKSGTSERGRVLGRYQLVRRLAVGGMAEIHLARQLGIEGFEKQVVLKRTLPEHATNVDFISMFLDEAKLVASLHHPNIVQVTDIGQDGNSYFYVMEHLEGLDGHQIQRALERRADRLPLEHAFAVAMGAAAGLHAAHQARGPDGEPLEVVHRDVSPANLIVTFDGSVKLIDFGVAKASNRRTTTRHGVVKGKVCFMSPEQCTCRPLDRRSDVFALGIMIYELTTGTRLFDGPSEFEIMQQIVELPLPRPSERLAGYPPALEAVVLRALAREPDDRYATADELYGALEETARGLGLALSQYGLGQYVRELAEEDSVDFAVETTPSAPVFDPHPASYAELAVTTPPPGARKDSEGPLVTARFEGMDTIDLADASLLDEPLPAEPASARLATDSQDTEPRAPRPRLDTEADEVVLLDRPKPPDTLELGDDDEAIEEIPVAPLTLDDEPPVPGGGRPRRPTPREVRVEFRTPRATMVPSPDAKGSGRIPTLKPGSTPMPTVPAPDGRVRPYAGNAKGTGAQPTLHPLRRLTPTPS